MNYDLRNTRPLTLRFLPACAAVTLAGSPGWAADRNTPAPDGSYHRIVLEKDGRAEAGALDVLADEVGRDVEAGRSEIVVLVHGFDVSQKVGTADYSQIARRLRANGEQIGLKPAIVGVHWDSDAGGVGSWMLQATGSRLASLFGARRVVKNPYLEKCRLAEQTGRTGLRSVFFRLQDRFPQVPIHVFAHSLGASVLVHALAPEAGAAGAPIEQPDRPLHLGAVTLAGADLDCDTFTRAKDTAVRLALRRAQVWWVTVPDKDKADGALELRRGAGKGDAVGNRGLELEREDLDRLLTRRALVIDQGNVPAGHRLTSYYNDRRVKELATSLLYLRDPEAPAAQESVLASLDRVLTADRDTLASTAAPSTASARLYAAWRRDPAAGQIDTVRIARVKSPASQAGSVVETADPIERVAGIRQVRLEEPRTKF